MVCKYIINLYSFRYKKVNLEEIMLEVNKANRGCNASKTQEKKGIRR